MYACEILKDSLNSRGHRLTTMEITYPRIVHGEVMTHRKTSRNSASSRAKPLEWVIAQVRRDPFIPEFWGKNQKGMQAYEELTGWRRWFAKRTWKTAMHMALVLARMLDKLNLHKQLGNRILEPFCWHTIVITATDWGNFFALRTDKAAQPEIRRIALLMQEAYETSVPKVLTPGEWHKPYVDDDEGFSEMDGVKVSTGRCARNSYGTQHDKRAAEREIAMHDGLIADGHMSPTEHQARGLTDEEWDLLDRLAETIRTSNEGNAQYRTTLLESVYTIGNFKGFMQYRKTIPFEDDYSKVLAAAELQPA